MPKHDDQNVLPIGIQISPSSLKEPNKRLASSSLAVVSESEKTFKLRLPAIPSIRHHQRRVADLQAHVHDFVFGTGRNMAVSLAGISLKRISIVDFGAQRLPVELGGFFAAAIEKQIRLKLSLHKSPFIVGCF